MMPMQHGLTLTEQLLAKIDTHSSFQRQGSWDAGRLVVMPEYRVGQDVLKRCLYLSLTHLMEITEVVHLFGSCTHVLSRLYRRFGFTIFAKNVPLEGAEKHYTLIHGDVPTVLSALAVSNEALTI